MTGRQVASRVLCMCLGMQQHAQSSGQAGGMLCVPTACCKLLTLCFGLLVKHTPAPAALWHFGSRALL